MLVVLSVVIYVYLFFYDFCIPRASCPVIPDIFFDVFSMFEISNFLLYVLINTLIAIIINIGSKTLSQTRFIPYNVALNLLVKMQNRNSNSYEVSIKKSLFLLFLTFLLLEDPASVCTVIDSTALDVYCYKGIVRVIEMNFIIFYVGRDSVIFIVLRLTRILNTCCYCSSELTALWIFSLLIMMSADVHPNPGPSSEKNFSSGFLSFCNWNLNTLSKDDFYRISLLEAHNTIFKYDIISLCETSLDDDTVVPENALPGYC